MSCKLFDTHTHFNFNAFKDDWEEVIGRTLAQNVWFVNVGAEAKTSSRAVEIALKYPEGVFASVGLHPIHVYDDEYAEEVNGEKVKFITRAEEFDKNFYTGLIKKSKKVVAIGETGLDYFHIKKFTSVLNKKLKAKQAEVFVEQIKLASELNKPIIIHCRPDKDYDAYKEILNILSEYNKPRRVGSGLRPEPENSAIAEKKGSSHLPAGEAGRLEPTILPGIVHCFQGDAKILEEFLNLGFMIGFNGVITFTDQYDGLVKATPLEKIVLETDAPWLAPVPHRGQRNESIYVSEVAKRIAGLRNISYEEVAEITTNNAFNVFKIKSKIPNPNPLK